MTTEKNLGWSHVNCNVKRHYGNCNTRWNFIVRQIHTLESFKSASYYTKISVENTSHKKFLSWLGRKTGEKRSSKRRKNSYYDWKAIACSEFIYSEWFLRPEVYFFCHEDSSIPRMFPLCWGLNYGKVMSLKTVKSWINISLSERLYILQQDRVIPANLRRISFLIIHVNPGTNNFLLLTVKI